MTTEKVIATLQQVKALVEGSIKELEGGKGRIKKPATHPAKQPSKVTEISFNTNALAFMKKHARGLSGPQKFTVLLARLVEGNISKEVAFSDLEKQWNKMKVVLGGKFNAAYANRAKANGWVDTPKHGTYTLSHSWKGALTKVGV